MIRHVVIFQFDKEKANDAAIIEIKSELEALTETIPELIKMEVGINSNPSEKQDLVLIADVKDLTDLDIYAKHPFHLAVATKIKAIACQRTCVDYEI